MIINSLFLFRESAVMKNTSLVFVYRVNKIAAADSFQAFFQLGRMFYRNCFNIEKFIFQRIIDGCTVHHNLRCGYFCSAHL